MIEFTNKKRSSHLEIMDDFEFQGEEMKNVLNDIQKVNKWLGGNRLTLNGLSELLKDHPKDKEITIVDLGCGDGEMLRECLRFATLHGYKFQCIGIDFNPHILEIARKKSESFSNIQFQTRDVFSENSIPNCDIALATLVLHHFTDDQVVLLLQNLLVKTKLGIVVNDLQRSKMAFDLFKIVSKIFLKTNTAKYDGLVSVARGFKKTELEGYSEKIPNQTSTINWQWAFRYQWILKKNNSDLS